MAFTLASDLDKSCLNDFGYSEEFCENLLDHDAENTEVQNAVAQFSVYESIVDHLIPILFSFFLGSWSDNFGRKYLLYLFFFFCLVNTSKFVEWFPYIFFEPLLIRWHDA